MRIKYFIIAIYSLAGLFIAAATAFITFLIIGTPIGLKMTLQIISTIIFMLPVIILISYLFGRYLSKKFDYINVRLKEIEEESFKDEVIKSPIYEIEEINQSMNNLSLRLETLINDLREKNQNLSNLLISMAHDVKTPITILTGYIEEIQDGLVQKKDLGEILKRMKNEIDFLDELTVDMLDFISSMNNHKVKEEINLSKLVNYELVPILPSSKEIELQNEIDEDFTCTFNRVDLKKIILNMINNAYKYTDNGYIKLYTLNSAVVFENSGKKIPKEYFEKIFEPFFTVSKSKNRKTSGFGLGLSIVRNLSKNNGYYCFLQSSDEEKTVFLLKKSEKDEESQTI